MWCNGNTTDFDSVISGSSPDTGAIPKCVSVQQGKLILIVSAYKALTIALCYGDVDEWLKSAVC